MSIVSDELEEIFRRLLAHFGHQHWWPGETPFEVMVGAVLTQNTNWQNVEKAIANLREAGLLSLSALAALSMEELAEHIRPAGYYNIKAGRLQNLFSMIEKHWDNDLDYLLQQPLYTLREQLLSVKGIGPETADAIVLYAAEQPIFVVDTYTHRILMRHEIISEDYDYFQIQEMFMDNLNEDAALFNEYHALLVQVGKQFCKKSKPHCERCPLAGVGGVEELIPC
ncbi:MAG: endonuclease III domain-containing protein [Candidatus Electrothrix sp. AX5]|jgi:endonuclease-3 related protein|uniref:DNA-3-methyladenine glycosylase III n=1 Tax=Candidatus Electrothrix aarhusensis TaxID=1859131 RepID=A0A3S3R6Z9_9BACT|nr:endonuclease III domain-containing protein [Candidatus Electrothrix sp. AX5]RWX45822.1 DNA-3-methyladenine glycosylase III [Candidatus Electrothrix aarhusensis]